MNGQMHQHKTGDYVLLPVNRVKNKQVSPIDSIPLSPYPLPGMTEILLKKGHKIPSPYLSTFRKFHGGDSARSDVFDPFFLRLSARGKSLGISMGETFFLLTIRLIHNNKNIHFKNY